METQHGFQPRLIYNNYKEHIKVSHELELLFKRYRKWYTKHFNLDDRLEEHEFPIFFLKEKKIY